MKAIKLFLASLSVASFMISAKAEVSITAPVLPEGLSVESIADSTEYYLYNVGIGKFMNRNESEPAFCGWSDTPYAFRFDLINDNWYALWQGGYYLGTDWSWPYYINWEYSEYIDSYNYYRFEKNEDGSYCFYSRDDAPIGYTYENYEHVRLYCWDEYRDWLIIPIDAVDGLPAMTHYGIMMSLYNAIVRADAMGYGVTRYVNIYNDSSKSDAELQAAANELTTAVNFAQNHSGMFPAWSEELVMVTDLGTFDPNWGSDRIRKGFEALNDTTSFSVSVYVDEVSQFVFRFTSDANYDNRPTLPFKVYIDGNVAMEYSGDTHYGYSTDYYWTYNVSNNNSNNNEYSRPATNYDYVNYNSYDAPRYYYVDLAAGNHDITVEFTNKCDGSTAMYVYELGVISKNNVVTANINEKGSLFDGIIDQVSRFQDIRRLKVIGTLSEEDWNDIYDFQYLFSLDLSEANISAIAPRQLSRHYHNSLRYLHEVVLPEGLTGIGREAFLGSVNMVTTIPSGVTRIGKYAFANTCISEANLSNVDRIDAGAFYGCSNLTSVTASNLSKLCGAAFEKCYNLQTATLAGALDTIPADAFLGCSNLVSITMPDAVKLINSHAFYDNQKLAITHLPDSLKTIEYRAFENNYMFAADLPASLSYVREYAFREAFRDNQCQMLTLPKTAQYSDRAFENANILNVTMQNNVNVWQLFNGCTNLKGIKLLTSTMMGSIDNAIWNLSKDSITIYVPDYLYSNYRRNTYWTEFHAVEPFDNSELTDIVLENNFALKPNYRFSQTQNLELMPGVTLSVMGEAGMTVNNVKLNNNMSGNQFSQIQSQSDAITVNGECEEVVYMNDNEWRYIALPFDCDFTRIKVDNGQFAIRYYDGAQRASGVENIIENNEEHTYPESAHNYSDGMNEETEGNKQTFAYSGAESLHIKFNANTSFESGCDYLHIRDANGYELTYSGSSLAGQIVTVNGDSFEIWITSDGSVTRYGYSIDAIYLNNVPHLNSWKEFAAGTSTIPAGKGFIFSTSQSTNAHFYSVANSTRNSIFMSNEEESNEVHIALDANECDDKQHAGWNLVGNPFQNYYYTRHLNFTAPITVWERSWGSYRAISLRDDQYVLQPMQAFFVQRPEAMSDISFPMGGRQLTLDIEGEIDIYAPAGRDVEMEVPDRQIVELSLSLDDMTDNTRVVLNEEASLSYERSCDASKFMSTNAAVPQFYSLMDGTKYAINERPVADGNVKLGAYMPSQGVYVISLGRNQAQAVELTDKQNGKVIDLSAGDYVFESEAGTFNERFEINVIRMVPTNIEDVAAGQDTDANVMYYDLNGRVVSSDASSLNGVYMMYQGGKAKKVNIK